MRERGSLTHALRVTEGSAAFRSLYEAIERGGGRAGWLDLGVVAPAPASDPAIDGELGASLGDGVWKAVGVEAGRTVSIKRRRGAAVLRDLLREHFGGCSLVLVRGDAPLPLLRSHGDDWEIDVASGEVLRLTTEALVSALRSPHFAS